ncbi:hypothetical protein [Geopseudomonas aromaticivorans]
MNVQLFMLGSSVTAAVSSAPVAESAIPEHVVEQLAEGDRLRAENAALQVIVRHATFNKAIDEPVSTAPAPAATPAVTWESLTSLPSLPMVATAPAPARPAASQPARTAPIPASTPAKGATKEAAPAVVFRPIRTREDGALLYLASDGNIRVVRKGGQLYAMNGRFIESDGHMAIFEMAGRSIPIPLLSSGT